MADNPLLSALGWIGSSLDKPGAAVRGLLGGDPSSLLNLVPFSDTMGLTDPAKRVSGRQLLEKAGVVDKGVEGSGLDMGDVAGFGVDMATDPLNWLGGLLAARRSLGASTIAARGEPMAFESLATVGPRTDVRKVPFPVHQDQPYLGSYKLAGMTDAPVQNVPITNLTATQPTVIRQHVEKYAPPAARDPATVIRVGGESYLDDGHHRAIASYLAGDPTVPARVWSYDPLTKSFSPVQAPRGASLSPLIAALAGHNAAARTTSSF
jgi:hypothetical protein